MRIPLYNQTGQPSVQTKAQQLSPRVSAGAFTSQGQAIAQLGQQISKTGQSVADNMIRFRQQQEKIEFDFAMAEKDAETQRVLNESATTFNEQSLKFIEDNKDTDTTKFRANYENFTNDFLSQNVDARPDLTDNQKLRIKTGLNQQIISKGNAGAKNAFDRMQVIRTQAATDALFVKMQNATALPSDHPERARLIQEIENDIITNERDGLNTGYSVKGVKVAFEKLDLNSRINAATSHDQLDQITKDVGVSSLGADGKQSMIRSIKTRRSEVRNEITQRNVGALFDMEFRFDDRDKVEEHIRDGKPLEGVDAEGERVVLDTSGMRESARESFIQTYVGRRFKDLDDVTTQSAVSGLVNQAITGDSPVEIIESANELLSDNNLEFLGKTKDQMVGVILESAEQMQQEAGRMVASGEYDEGAVNDLLNASQALLETEIGGNPAIVRLSGDDANMGDTANVITTRIAKLRGDMASANASQIRVEQVLAFGEKGQIGLNAEAVGIKPDEIQTAISTKFKSMTNLNEQMEYLQSNGVEFDYFKASLEVGRQRLSNPNMRFEDLSDNDKLAIAVFENMSMRPELLQKHLQGEDLAWWRTFETMVDLYGIEGGLDQLKRIDPTADISPKYNAIRDQVEVTVDEAVEQPWWNFISDSKIPPQNTGYVLEEIRNLSKVYLRMGVAENKAVERAATQFAASHDLVRGIYIQKMTGTPENLPQIADIVVSDFARKNLKILQDNDMTTEDLGLVNTAGSTDRWYLVRDGGFLMRDENDKFISFSKNELLKYKEQAKIAADSLDLKQLNRSLKMGQQGGSPFIETEDAQEGA